MSSYQLVEAKWYALIKNCLVSHVCLQQIETSDWIKARISAFTSKASEVFRSVCHCENRTYFLKMSDVLQNFADDVFNFDCDRELSNGNRIFHGQRKTVSVGDACKHGEVIVLIFSLYKVTKKFANARWAHTIFLRSLILKRSVHTLGFLYTIRL